MVPISKSIWPFILFVYLNLHFILIIRFNSLCCFSKTFSRERSSPPPPNFASPFCAFCLIVYDFLPKTWDLGRKNTPSVTANAVTAPPRGRLNPLSHRCAMPAPPKGELNSLSQSLTALTAPSGREPLAKPETLRHSLKPSPWGRWLDAKRQDGRGFPLGSGLALSVKPCRACQLSQRESPWHDGKLSGVSANLPVPPEPLPLGEVDANAVSRRRGRGRTSPRDCFLRKQARPLPFAFTTPPVKMQSRAARRLPDFALIINNFSAEYG